MRRRRSIAYRLHLVDEWGMTVFGVMLSLLSIVAVAAAVIGFAGIQLSRVNGRHVCRTFGEQTGYTTKFVILNWNDSGTCLARSKSGHWVLNTKLLVVNQ